MNKLLLLALPLALLGCPATPEPRPPSPPAPEETDCDAAEQRLLDLQCKDRRGRLIGGLTLRGKTWREVCWENTMNGVDMKTDCISQAPSCAGVSLCR